MLSANQQKLSDGLERMTKFRFTDSSNDGFAVRNFLLALGELKNSLQTKDSTKTLAAIDSFEGSFSMMATTERSGFSKYLTSISETEHEDMLEVLDAVRDELIKG